MIRITKMEQYLADLSIDYHGPTLIDQLANENVNVALPSFLTVTQSAKNREKPLEAGFNDKLARFIACKAASIFKHNKPMRSGQEHCANSFATVPPVESFMVIPGEARKFHFYQSLQLGDVLVCTVSDVEEHGLTVLVMGLANGKARNVSDLCIRAFCPLRELPRLYPHQDPLEGFTNRDKIKSVVIGVSLETEKILISLLPRNLPDKNPNDNTQLGLISDDEVPLYLGDDTCSSHQSYQDQLESVLEFSNPSNVTTLCDIFLLPDTLPSSAFRNLGSLHYAQEDCADQLRMSQSARWAMTRVEEGIIFFKKGNYVEALQYFNKALDIDPNNVEGLVARGALYANNESYDRAVADFESALKLNPMHANGRKYLCHTLIANARDVGQRGLTTEAAELYKKALELDPDLKEALIGLQNTTHPRHSQANMITDDWTSTTEDKMSEKIENDTSYERTSHMLRMMISEKRTSDEKVNGSAGHMSSGVRIPISFEGNSSQIDEQTRSSHSVNNSISWREYSEYENKEHCLPAKTNRLEDNMQHQNLSYRYSSKSCQPVDSFDNAPCFQSGYCHSSSTYKPEIDEGGQNSEIGRTNQTRKCVHDKRDAVDGLEAGPEDLEPAHDRHSTKTYRKKKQDSSTGQLPSRKFKVEHSLPQKDFEEMIELHSFDTCQKAALGNTKGSSIPNMGDMIIRKDSKPAEMTLQAMGTDYTKTTVIKPTTIGLISTKHKQNLVKSKLNDDRSLNVPVYESGKRLNIISKPDLSIRVQVRHDSHGGDKQTAPSSYILDERRDDGSPKSQPAISIESYGNYEGTEMRHERRVDTSPESPVVSEKSGSHFADSYNKIDSQSSSSSHGSQTNKKQSLSQNKRKHSQEEHIEVRRKSKTRDLPKKLKTVRAQPSHKSISNSLSAKKLQNQRIDVVKKSTHLHGKTPTLLKGKLDKDVGHIAKVSEVHSESVDDQCGHHNPWESKWDSPPTTKDELNVTKATPQESLEDLENFLLLLKKKQKKAKS